MKLRQIISSFIVALSLAFAVVPAVSADIQIVGSDGKAVQADVDEDKINAGVGKVVFWGGIIFGGVVTIGLVICGIAMAMGKRQFVQEHMVNIIGAILLFAFGGGAAASIIAAVS